jgi:ribonuclease BN (tRNA processing enzyme)
MELTVVGSGTAAVTAERGPSAYVLRAGPETILLDGGTGTLQRCLRAGISYQEVDRVFYTHLHPDHTIELVPFLFATRHTPGFTRTSPLYFYGPGGFKDFFYAYVNLFSSSLIEVDYQIHIQEFAETSVAVGDIAVTTRFMRHSENAIGYRFENAGKCLVYSGDTDYCEGILELASDADVLILDCSFPDSGKVAGHLTPSEAARIASQAGVAKLVLSHLYPPVDEIAVMKAASAVFGGEIIVARDLMKIHV